MSIVDDKPPSSASRSPKKKGRWLVPGAVAAGAFVLLLSPLWAPMLLRGLDFFRVRHVEIVGARYLPPAEILERLAVDTLASVWDPTDRLELRVADHPLVRDVDIGRKLPGTLVVRIIEHVPVALVALETGFRAYDERGVALPIDPTIVDVDAPILSRPDTALLRLLGAVRTHAPELYQRVSEVRREGVGPGSGELVIVLDSLPVRALPDISLQRLADIQLVEKDIARRQVRAVELDLRYRDQVIVRLQ